MKVDCFVWFVFLGLPRRETPWGTACSLSSSLCCFIHFINKLICSFINSRERELRYLSFCSANQLNQLFFFCFLFLAEPHAACGGHNPPIKRKEKQLISLIFFAASLAPSFHSKLSENLQFSSSFPFHSGLAHPPLLYWLIHKFINHMPQWAASPFISINSQLFFPFSKRRKVELMKWSGRCIKSHPIHKLIPFHSSQLSSNSSCLSFMVEFISWDNF